ncbi:hypothetical protein ACTMU2_41735 [Cupriavidus basilensis]
MALALEARDVLAVLQRTVAAAPDLRVAIVMLRLARCWSFAGGTKGHRARKLPRPATGLAARPGASSRRSREAQGGLRVPGEAIFRRDIVAPHAPAR